MINLTIDIMIIRSTTICLDTVYLSTRMRQNIPQCGVPQTHKLAQCE